MTPSPAMRLWLQPQAGAPGKKLVKPDDQGTQGGEIPWATLSGFFRLASLCRRVLLGAALAMGIAVRHFKPKRQTNMVALLQDPERFAAHPVATDGHLCYSPDSWWGP